jgi:hypothetical protein
MSETEAAKPDANPEKEADHFPYRRPVDAATLILVDRTGATPKVLVGKRHDKVVFQPGKIVFPGGRVDPSDARVPVAAPIPAPLEANLLKKPASVLDARILDARVLNASPTARHRPSKAHGNRLPMPACCQTRQGFFWLHARSRRRAACGASIPASLPPMPPPSPTASKA